MRRVLNIIGYVFILLVLASSVCLYIFRTQVFAYLNRINNVNDLSAKPNLDAAALGIQTQAGSVAALNADTILNSDKFKKMQAVKVDLSGLVLPGGAVDASSTASTSAKFKVGNKQPFKAF